MKTITVNTDKPYDIYLGEDLIKNLNLLIKPIINSNKIAIITDDIVETIYGHSIANALSSGENRVFMYSFKNGEASKSFETYHELIYKLLADGFNRNDTLISLGGGVCGDITGFIAATYMRGTKLIHIPTTLLACVDSSIGGKNGINFKGGKNLIGTYYQPDLVVIDTLLLRSLDDLNLKNGLGEVIKYAFIGPKIYDNLIKHDSLIKLIENSIAIKKHLVEEDEKDLEIRHLLNLGHTVGHGIEVSTDYEIPHGFAVAMGLYLMAKISFKLGFCDKKLPEQVKSIITSYGLNLNLPDKANEVISIIKMDKKAVSEGINIVIPTDIGKSQTIYKSFNDLENLILQVWNEDN